jgi:hypothetical protein
VAILCILVDTLEALKTNISQKRFIHPPVALLWF